MNRIKAIALIAAFLLLSGCANVEKAEIVQRNVGRFVVVEDAMDWDVVADRCRKRIKGDKND